MLVATYNLLNFQEAKRHTQAISAVFSYIDHYARTVSEWSKDI